MGLGCRLSAVGLLLSTLQVCIWSQESIFAIVGEDVTFSPKVNGNIREITWLKKKNKVAEWEVGGVVEYFSTLTTRGALETSSGNLTIKMLNTDDAAEYKIEFLLVGNNNLKRKQIVLEVLERPPPPVLNCSISNGQIKILCTKNFSKDVHYSWYLDGQIVNDISSAVYESEKIPDSSKTVECAISVSKTQIKSAISLSTCFQESAVSPSRGRDGLIAIFVLLPVIAVGVLLCWWKRDWLRRIFGRIFTMHPDEQRVRLETHHSRNGECQGEEGAKLNQPDESRSEDDKDSENTKVPDEVVHCLPTGQDDPGSSQFDHKSQNDKEEEKNSQELKAVTTNDPPGNQENPDYENIKVPGSHTEDENRALLSEEERNSQESKAVTTNDPPDNQENPGSHTEDENRALLSEEERNSQESKAGTTNDPPGNQENPDSENTEDPGDPESKRPYLEV